MLGWRFNRLLLSWQYYTFSLHWSKLKMVSIHVVSTYIDFVISLLTLAGIRGVILTPLAEFFRLYKNDCFCSLLLLDMLLPSTFASFCTKNFDDQVELFLMWFCYYPTPLVGYGGVKTPSFFSCLYFINRWLVLYPFNL